MESMTCHEVENQLDLLAAGECDPSVRFAVEGHLQQCPACSESYAQSRRLLNALDLHWNDHGRERLRHRIEKEAHPSRQRLFARPWVQRGLALAALLLITLGLVWVWPRGQLNEPELELAVLVVPDKVVLKTEPPAAIGPARESSARVPASNMEARFIAPPGQSGDAFRSDLRKALRDGNLPLPTNIHLVLKLKNTGNRPVEIQLGDAAALLSLDVQGEGVIRMPAGKVEPPEILRPQDPLKLAPGQHQLLNVDRLIAGTPDRLEYIYLTEAVEYTLTARLRLTAGGKVVTVESETLHITPAK